MKETSLAAHQKLRAASFRGFLARTELLDPSGNIWKTLMRDTFVPEESAFTRS